MRKFSAEERLDGKRAVVVGAGCSGRAAALLLHALGAFVRVLERTPSNLDQDFADEARKKGMEVVLGEHGPKHFAGFDMVVLSPGVPARVIRELLPVKSAPPVIAELEFAGRYVTEPILAVTGTNGKTTTTALAGAVLKHIGRRVFVGGNIGSPLSEYVLGDEEADVLVLEVSSFQAQNCYTFKPDTAVLLNFSANHLDFHADMDEYLRAKLNLFARMEPFDLAILPAKMRARLEALNFTRARRMYFESTDRFESDRLPGAHNQANMEAAYQACARFGATQRDVKDVLENFYPLPHRLQKVAEKKGVLFVDDSKSTTVDSLRAAISSFDRPVLLLAGGLFKGGDLESLLPLLRQKVRQVCLFGGAREIFEAAWAGRVPLTWEPDLARAVAVLCSKAEAGDVVLLSPATASFDLYENYKARGRDFQRIVGALS